MKNTTSHLFAMLVLPGIAFAAAPTSASREPMRDPNDIPIVESWTHLQPLYLGANTTTRIDHMLFFANGVVVRATPVSAARYSYFPQQCYAALPVANPEGPFLDYGRWTEDKVAQTVRIDWPNRGDWNLQRQGKKLLYQGSAWSKFESIDGIKFTGVYVYKRPGDPPAGFAFTQDGRFEVRNAFEDMLCANGQQGMMQGSGTYEVRKWTLILRFSNGVTNILPISVLDEHRAKAKIPSLFVKSYPFELVP